MQLRLRTKSYSCRDNPDTYGQSCATSQQCALFRTEDEVATQIGLIKALE